MSIQMRAFFCMSVRLILGSIPRKGRSMHQRSLRGFFLLSAALLTISPPSFAARPKPCRTADEASRILNKDICISAHIYDVVQLPDGTRFLDVCTPDTPDERCRFTIISFWEDRDEVG